MIDDKSYETLTKLDEGAIENEIKKAAWDHLNARDADTALSHYKPGATVITNGIWFESFKSFEKDVRNFYMSLKEVKLAVWDQIQIQILSPRLALFTGSVLWPSVDKSGSVLKLKGIWSATYSLEKDKWKILLRHESFEQDDKID